MLTWSICYNWNAEIKFIPSCWELLDSQSLSNLNTFWNGFKNFLYSGISDTVVDVWIHVGPQNVFFTIGVKQRSRILCCPGGHPSSPADGAPSAITSIATKTAEIISSAFIATLRLRNWNLNEQNFLSQRCQNKNRKFFQANANKIRRIVDHKDHTIRMYKKKFVMTTYYAFWVTCFISWLRITQKYSSQKNVESSKQNWKTRAKNKARHRECDRECLKHFILLWNFDYSK